jgi:O-antigen ligase
MLLKIASKGSQTDPHKLALLLLGAMCLVPFLQPRHFSPIRSFYDEWLAFALGLAAAGLISVTRGSEQRRVPVLSIFLALFALMLFLRAFGVQAAYPQSALLWGLYALFAAFIVFLGYDLATQYGRERICDVIAACLLVGALLNSLAGALQVIGIPPFLDPFVSHLTGRRAIGNIGQANLYANYLALGEASLLYLYSRGKIDSLPAVLTGIILVMGAALAASRSAVLYSAGFALLAYVGFRHHRDGQTRRLLKTTILLAASVVVAQWIVPAGMNALGFPMESGFLRAAVPEGEAILRDDAAALRLLAWELAAKLFITAPWIGVGPDEFAGSGFRLGLPPQMAEQVWVSPHNLILQLLSQTGLVGASLICVGLAAWLFSAGKAFLKGPDVAGWWVLSCIAVELMHAMLEYPLWYAHFLAVTALILGIGSTGGAPVRAIQMRGVLAPCVIAGVLLLGVQLTNHFQFDRASPVSAGRSLAIDRDVAKDREVLMHLSKGLLAPRAEIWLFFSFPLDAVELAEKVAVGERVLKVWPSSSIVVRQSVFLVLSGRHDEAVALFERGLSTFKTQKKAMAEVLAAAPEDARRVLEQSLLNYDPAKERGPLSP